jgi:hypothetical protein
MKKVLIISPHFPPVNAADMHRIRLSLPYFRDLGWEAEVICVNPVFVEAYSIDNLLLLTIPEYITIHQVNALDVKFTRKFGLGSLSIRSFLHYLKKGNDLLSSKKFDLVYFSTTAFHVMALGPYWRKKYGVPFILDIQDPWRNDFYLDKTKNERPPKFWIAYTIDKYLEKYVIPRVDGIISVSQGYIDTFKQRYRNFKDLNSIVIPFAGSKLDFEVLKNLNVFSSKLEFNDENINIVYAGRGGHDMQMASSIFFKALRKGLDSNPNLFSKIHCWFLGTSYSSDKDSSKTFASIAKINMLGDMVTEISERLPYFETLYFLKKADILFIPGSIDVNYTASKIFPYIISATKIIAIFNSKSSVVEILKKSNAGEVIEFQDNVITEEMIEKTRLIIYNMLLHPDVERKIDWTYFNKHLAEEMTKKQVDFFQQIIERND